MIDAAGSYLNFDFNGTDLQCRAANVEKLLFLSTDNCIERAHESNDLQIAKIDSKLEAR